MKIDQIQQKMVSFSYAESQDHHIFHVTTDVLKSNEKTESLSNVMRAIIPDKSFCDVYLRVETLQNMLRSIVKQSKGESKVTIFVKYTNNSDRGAEFWMMMGHVFPDEG